MKTRADGLFPKSILPFCEKHTTFSGKGGMLPF
nr:MAG TPA: Aldos-2-ulose dehydratase/isomerase cupin domain protein [Caudoviricetes sp.]